MFKMCNGYIRSRYIFFDENNFCNHCNEFFEFKQDIAYKKGESEKKLEKLVERIKKSGRKINMIV